MFEVGKTYPDKRGASVEIIFDIGQGSHPIVGVDTHCVVTTYTRGGYLLCETEPTCYDLIQPEESVYVVKQLDGYIFCTCTDKETALKSWENDSTKTVWRYVLKEQIK